MSLERLIWGKNKWFTLAVTAGLLLWIWHDRKEAREEAERDAASSADWLAAQNRHIEEVWANRGGV